MPERFGFACFVATPVMPAPVDAINAAVAALPGWIGAPVEAMALDFQSGRQTMKPWQAAEAMLRARPGRTEMLFAYYTCLHGEVGRACVGFEEASGECVVTVSLPDMTIADDPQQVIEVCLSLLAVGDLLGGTCVVAAGGEIELDAELGSPGRAIAAAMDSNSLAQWVACDGSLAGCYTGFQVAHRAGSALVLRRK